MDRAKRPGNGHQSEDEKQKLETLVDKVVSAATQGAEAVDLEFDAVYANGDDCGLTIVINLNLKDLDLDDDEKDNLFLERLGTLIEEQLGALDTDDPDEPEQ